MVAMLAQRSMLSEQFPRITQTLDENNLKFTSETKARLSCLSNFSESALEWLMVEHYQFSNRNPGFLSTAARTTKSFEDPAVTIELERNFHEEETHAAIYKRALMDIGTDVDERVLFAPTSQFLDKIQRLITGSPRRTLGTMYATETAAIFEHEVFLDISREVTARRELKWHHSRVKGFHDMHLAGVEQSHKDGLAGLVDRNVGGWDDWKEIFDGANEAIAAMDTWWKTLLARAERG